MVAYHLDRLKTLHEGQIISLKKADENLLNIQEVSYWGNSFLKFWDNPSGQPRQLDWGDLNTYSLENQAEQIRKRYFTYLPSRLSVMFGVSKLSDFSTWANTLKIDKDSVIYEVHFDGFAPELDSYYLRGTAAYIHNGTESMEEIIRLNSLVTENLVNYWAGNRSEQPMLELLIPLPATIGKRVSL